MRIDGLTQEQCDMLDIMWNLDTCEELYNFFQTLDQDEYRMAVTLHEMLIQEAEEEQLENSNMAKTMLQSIGVKLA